MESTAAQRMAVRRDECSAHGHRFSELTTKSSLTPEAVFCDNCLAMWRIHPDDIGKNFPNVPGRS